MRAKIVSSTPEKVILELEFSLSGSMPEQEQQIQEILNKAGKLCTGEAQTTSTPTAQRRPEDEPNEQAEEPGPGVIEPHKGK